MSDKTKIKALPLLKSAMVSLIDNKEILFPFIVLFLIQVLFLEIIYFYPRWPFNEFFGPIIIKATWGGQMFMHYPANLSLLSRLFQFLQMPIFIFLGSFFIGMAIATIAAINNGKPVALKSILKETWSSYLYLVIAASILYFLTIASNVLYDALLLRRAVHQAGKFIKIKKLIFYGAAYFKILLSVFVNTLFAYLIPAIIIDKKKIFGALAMNFKVLFRSFWFTFFVILIPTLVLFPIVLLRSSFNFMSSIPELEAVALLLMLLILTLIDAIVYTSLSAFYLLRKEDK